MENEDNSQENPIEKERNENSEQEFSKNPAVFITLAVIVIAGVGFYFLKKTNSTGSQNVLGNNTSITQGTTKVSSPSGKSMDNLKGQKLSDTRLSKSAYQIFPGNLSQDAKTALTGFDMKTKSLTDGSTQIDLVPTETGDNYKSQTYVVKTGYKLYFIELRLGDDQGTVDQDPRDDTAVLVDENGIIQ